MSSIIGPLRALATLVLITLLSIVGLSLPALATTYTMTVPGTSITLPAGYPEAGGAAVVLVGANGNVYYQFSDPSGAFVGYQYTGTPTAFRGNPFTINSPISLDCGFSTCATYFGGSIAQMYVRFSAYDGDTQVGGFDYNDITLRMNGYTVGNWSNRTTEITNDAGTVSQGFVTGFGNNTFNTGWFDSTNAALLANILSTGQVTTQVYDADPNDNYWDFRRGNSLGNSDIRTVAPGYTLEKTTPTTTFATVGETVSYSYVVTNIGSVPIRSLGVSDNRIASVTCDKTTIMDTSPGGTADFATCTGTYTITQADIDAGEVTNIAIATGVPDFGVLGTLSDTVTITGPTLSPSMTLDKTSTLTAFGAAGTSVPYSFLVTNTGNATLSSVAVTDPRLPGLSCTTPTLLPAATYTCSGSYTVTQADVDAFADAGTTLDNTASVSATGPRGTSASATDTLSLPGPTGAPALTIDKTTSETGFSAVGEVLDYTITVVNTGNLTFPSGPSVTDPTATISCPGGSLAPGATRVCTATHTVTQADLDAGSYTNTATATVTVAGQTVTESDSETLTATLTPSLTIDKRLAPASRTSFDDVGQSLTFVFELTNTGNVTLNAPSVSDTLVAATCPATPIAPGASVICTSATYTTTQADLNAGSVINTATASATPAGSATPVDLGTDSVTVPAVQGPELTLAKTAPAVAAVDFLAGNTISYSFEVTNSGNTDLTGAISVTDDRIGTFACAPGPLARGASVTCTQDYVITPADVTAGRVVNTATATNGTVTSAPDSATVAPTFNPAITMVKTADATTVTAVGQTVGYTFTVTNSGNTTILAADNPVTVSDPKVGAVDCAAQPAALLPGETFDCTATYGVTLADMDAGSLDNSATASFPFDGGSGPETITSDPAVSSVPVDETTGLVLTKAGPATFDTVGQSLTYTFSVENTGNVSLTSVTVTDPLIPTLSCTLGPIAPGATASCTDSYDVTQANVDAGSITNTASASGTTAQGTPASDDASSTATLAPGAGTRLATVVKSASPTSFTAAGETVTFTMTVTNTGTLTLAGLSVTDALDPGFSCAVPTLAPAAVYSGCTFTHVVTQAEFDAGSFANSASVLDGATPLDTDTVTVAGPARAASMTLSKAASGGYAAEGDTVGFTFSVANTGNVTLTDVTVTDALIPGFSCTIATLAPGATDTSCTTSYTVTQANVDAGSFDNDATVTATAPPGVTAPTPATAAITVAGPAAAPALTISKTAADGAFTGVGDTESYTFSVVNSGNVTLTGLSVSDPLAGFSCALDDLLPGATATTCAGGAPALGAVLTFDQADVDAGSVTNTATVTGETLVGGTPVSDTGSATVVGPTQGVSVTLDKTSTLGAAFSTLGQSLPYEFLVTNTSNISLTAPITVSDSRIASVSCPALPAAGLAPGASILCTGTDTVTQPDLDAGTITNTATASVTQPVVPVSPGDPSSITATDTDSETITAAQTPELSLTKRVAASSAPSFAAVGDTVVFEYLVRNSGNVTTTAPVTVVDDRIPGTLTCAAAGIAPGATVICSQTWTATQADLDAGTITNTATASTTYGGATVDSPPATATIGAVQTTGLTIDKTLVLADPDIFDVGTELSYAYELENTGNVTLSAPITVSDNLTAVTCDPVPIGGLDPGATLDCSATYTLSASDLAIGRTTNTATASAAFGTATVTSAPDAVTYPVSVSPALTVVKSGPAGTPAFSAEGDVLTYSYLVTNSGGTGFVEDISIIDDRIGTFVCRPASAGPFSVGDVFTCTADYAVTQPDVDSGSVTNSAIAQTTFAPGTPTAIDVRSAPDSVTLTGDEDPELTVAKDVTTGDDPAGLGDVLTYTITTTNTGNQTISAVSVDDPMVGTLACTVGGAPAPANVILLPGAALVCTGSYTVTQADVDAQVLTNTATARGADPQGAPVSGTGTDTHPLEAPSSALVVTKTVVPDPGTGPAFSIVGEVLTFAVSVQNTGNVTMLAPTVTDSRVPGATCSLPDLAPGATNTSCTFSYTVTQADLEAGFTGAPGSSASFDNTATARATPANPGATEVVESDTITVPGPAHEPAFSLVKTATTPSFAAVGDVLSYSYSVANIGNVTLTADPVVTDDRIGTISCPIGGPGLAPGATTTCTASYTVTQADVDAGSVTNIATVASPEVPLPTPAGVAEDSATVSAGQTPAMTLVKTPSVTADVTEGTVITYTYDVANTGNVTLFDVTPDDQHTSAAGTVALALGGDTLQVDGGAATGDSTDAAAAGVWSVLAPGDTVRFTSSYTVTQADIDAGAAITNAATVAADGPPGVPGTTAADTASVGVIAGAPALDVQKRADVSGLSATPVVGEVIAYTVTVTNTGNTTLSAVTPTDTLRDAAGNILTPGVSLGAPSGDDGNGLLDVAEVFTYTGTYTLTQAALDAGGVSNSVTVAAEDPSGAPVSDDSDDDSGASDGNGNGDPNDDPTVTTLATTATMAVVKAAVLDDGGDGVADVGDTIDYSYTVSNTGSVTLFDASVAETGFTGTGTAPVPAYSSGGADLGGGPEIDIAVGGSAVFTATYTLTQEDLDAGSVTNQATGSAEDPLGGPVTDISGTAADNDDPTETLLDAAPGVLATKTADISGLSTPAAVGDEVVFTIAIENTGNVSLTPSGIVDTPTDLDGGAMTAVLGVIAGDLDADGLLDVDEIWTLTATVALTQEAIDAGGISNTATITGETPDGTPITEVSDSDGPGADGDGDGDFGNDPTEVLLTPAPSVETTKIADTSGLSSPPQIGDAVVFTISVENTGNVTLTPTGIAESATDLDGGALVATLGPILGDTGDDGLLGVGETWSITSTVLVTAEALDAGGITNTVTVTGTAPDGTTLTDVSDSDGPGSDGDGDGDFGNDPTVVPLTQAPGMTVLKTADTSGLSDPALPGETVAFTITVANTGNLTLDTVTLSDVLTRLDTASTPLVLTTGPDLVSGDAGVAGVLEAGETWTYSATYVLLQEDIDGGGIENQATASAEAPDGTPITDVSDDDGVGADDPTTVPIVGAAAMTVTKSASEIETLFPTINRVTFTLSVENTGTLTMTNVQLTDDLAGFLDPATLLAADYPISITATGFAPAGANPSYDGVGDTGTLGAGATLAPGATGTVEITLTYSTTAGQPGAPNVAVATSDQITDGSSSNEVVLAQPDSDGDGAPDVDEGCGPGDDRDGDGVCNARDYDPTGYFYCEDDGRIIPGGGVRVSGPFGDASGVGTSNFITIVRDGSDGSYQFFVTRAGSYTLAITYPPGTTPSATRLTSGGLDATSLLPDNPAAIGSGEVGTTGRLADFSAGANVFYTTFDIEAGDPIIFNNNIPLANCAGRTDVLASKSADRTTAVFGETVNYTLEFTNDSARAILDGTFVDDLPSGLVYTPGSATLNGAPAEPVLVGRRLEWQGVDLDAGATATLRLAARVSGRAAAGDLVNRAWHANSAGERVSNIATAVVEIRPEAVFDCSDVIGKVFDDRNRNGRQDGPVDRSGEITQDDVYTGKWGQPIVEPEDPPGEKGIPGVRLATVNGLLITTDEYGRYHVPCAALPKDGGSNFTLKLDTRTLPLGYRVTTENPRTLRLTPGKAARMNFGATAGRIVDIDLTAGAFVPGAPQPKAALGSAVEGLIGKIAQEPSAVRLRYQLASGEDGDLAHDRLRAVERLIKDRAKGKLRYRLEVERVVDWGQ